jgi:hypothetical protein
MISTRPKLLPPKWRVIKNKHDNSIEIVAWNAPPPATQQKLQILELKKNWKPPFPRPKILPQ